jgi:hypothetical protein
VAGDERERVTRERTKRWIAGLATVAGGAALAGWSLAAGSAWAERHLLPSYCATSGVSWIAARSLRPLAAAAGLAALLAAPAVARALGRVRLHAPAPGTLAAVAVAIVASLAVGEAYLRHLHDRLTAGAALRPALARALPMTRKDPRLGWAYYPGRTTWTEVGERRIAYAIDADGDRSGTSDDRPDPERATVLFAGESIAFGYGLAYEETVPFLVGRGLGLQAVNLAVVGYGSDQAHLRVLDALARFPHPLAIVTLFIPDQIRRNVDSWRPRLVLGPGGALAQAPPSVGLRLAKLLEELPWHGDEALRVTAAVLRATADAARAHGALPLFVVTNYGSPCVHDVGAEPWVVQELFERQGLPFVRVDLAPEDRLPGIFERHPNADGARKIAAAVERALAGRLASGPAPSASPTAAAPSTGSPGSARAGGARRTRAAGSARGSDRDP